MTRSASFDSPRKKSFEAETLFCASWNLRTCRPKQKKKTGEKSKIRGEQHHKLVHN